MSSPRPEPSWVVVQHLADEGPGTVSDVLADAGVAATVVRIDRGDRYPTLDGVGGIVVMGGTMGVNDTADFSWLADERSWLAAAVAARRPVLGICLGAQQLAAACGAKVWSGPAPEIAITPVRLTDAGRRDPVLGPEGDELTVLHWHGDTFDVPAGAELLAVGDVYRHQAFKLAPRAYGLQFHLEVDRALLDEWEPTLPPGVTLDEADRAAVEAVGRRVFARFVAAALAD